MVFVFNVGGQINRLDCIWNVCGNSTINIDNKCWFREGNRFERDVTSYRGLGSCNEILLTFVPGYLCLMCLRVRL